MYCWYGICMAFCVRGGSIELGYPLEEGRCYSRNKTTPPDVNHMNAAFLNIAALWV